MTIAWGEIEIHPITYDDGTTDIVAGSQFKLLCPEGVLSGVIGKALNPEYSAEEYEDILDHEGFGVVLTFAKDSIITLSAIDPTEPTSLVPYSEYILDSYRLFLNRRAGTSNPAAN
jgi:hypothetical protein